MIVRTKIEGYKNIAIDVQLAACTWVLGKPNAGKTSFFNALALLGRLANEPLEQALFDGDGRRSYRAERHFCRADNVPGTRMSFEFDLVVAAQAMDETNQRSKTRHTSVRYRLVLGREQDRITIVEEHLETIPFASIEEAGSAWKKSLGIANSHEKKVFISTVPGDDDGVKIRLHAEQGRRDHTDYEAASLPRTILSMATSQHPTASAVRQELMAWQVFTLVPHFLKMTDNECEGPQVMSPTGQHLPETLYQLALRDNTIYDAVAARVEAMGSDPISVWVENRNGELTLFVREHSGIVCAARDLSDTMLRRIGVAVIACMPCHGGIRAFDVALDDHDLGIIMGIEGMAMNMKDAISGDNQFCQVLVSGWKPLTNAMSIMLHDPSTPHRFG